MDAISEARRQGFELEERVLHDQWMWGWRCDDDERWSPSRAGYRVEVGRKRHNRNGVI